MLLAGVVAALALVFAGTAQGTTICDVQEFNAQGLSPLLGQNVTVTGIVTVPPGYFQPEYTSIYIESDGCGINVFSYLPASTWDLEVGDEVSVRGEVEEYISGSSGAGATTEIFAGGDSTAVEVLSTGNPAPEPAYMYIADIAQEENEGRLVRALGVVLTTNLDYNMQFADETGLVVVYRNYNDYVDFSGFWEGDTLEITGVVLQYDQEPPYLDGYEIVPRFQSDMKYASFQDTLPPVFAGSARIDIEGRPFYPDIGEILPIAYAAPDASRTVMTVYDLQGREVRRLLDAVYDGHSALPEFYRERIHGWDGRDDLKRLVPPGTYICRLEVTDSDGETSTTTAPAVVGAKLK
jgi:hypothetical protein